MDILRVSDGGRVHDMPRFTLGETRSLRILSDAVEIDHEDCSLSLSIPRREIIAGEWTMASGGESVSWLAGSSAYAIQTALRYLPGFEEVEVNATGYTGLYFVSVIDEPAFTLTHDILGDLRGNSSFFFGSGVMLDLGASVLAETASATAVSEPTATLAQTGINSTVTIAGNPASGKWFLAGGGSVSPGFYPLAGSHVVQVGLSSLGVGTFQVARVDSPGQVAYKIRQMTGDETVAWTLSDTLQPLPGANVSLDLSGVDALLAASGLRAPTSAMLRFSSGGATVFNEEVSLLPSEGGKLAL